MTKKKSVMKVQMNCEKCRKKALKIAAGTYGVISVANEGKDNELITVVGISVDSVCLVEQLRKKVGHTELVSVTEVKEDDKKKDDKKEEKNKDEKKVPCPCYYCPPPCHSCPPLVAYGTEYDTNMAWPYYYCPPPCHSCPPLVAYGTEYDTNTSSCSIM